MVIHRTTDHGFGCDVGGMNETIRVDRFTLIVVQIKLRKEEWATNVAQYSKNTE